MVEDEERELDLLMTTDVAQLAGVSGDTVRAWERGGKLRAVRTPGRVRVRLFLRETVLAFLEQRAAARRRPLEAE